MKPPDARLVALRERLRDLPPGVPDALKLRRQRLALLRAFEASSRPKARSYRAAVGLGLGLLAVAVVALLVRASRPPNWVEVVAGSESLWQPHRTADGERIELHSGHFQLTIHRPSNDTRIVLALPDGEIEDLGTVLETWIVGDRTDYVAVQSGEVKLRLRGRPEVRLRAGEHWSRPSEAGVAQVGSATPDPPTSNPPSITSAPSAAEQTPKAAALPARVATRRVEPSLLGGVAPEDAAYVALLARLREGDRTAALVSARNYLRLYPHGLRRVEVERIAVRLANQSTAADAH